jgi:hypothetical protein
MLFGGRASFWPGSTTVRAILSRAWSRSIQLSGWRSPRLGGKVAFTFDRMPTSAGGRRLVLDRMLRLRGGALPWLGERVAGWVLGGEPAPALARLKFPLVPAPYEGRAWFLPLAGEWWRTQDRLAARSRRRA